MNKKAQAGVEFISTYGWAMLGIVLIMGTISYFTIDFQKTMPDKCDLGNIQCGSFVVSEQRDFSGLIEINNTKYKGIFGRVEFDFFNPESDVINISSVKFEFDNQVIISTCDSLSIIANPGRKTEIKCNLCKEAAGDKCESFLGEKDKDKINVNIKYKILGKSFDKHGQGEILFAVTETNHELPECYDGEDNDGDDNTDYPADLACYCGIGEDETETCEFKAKCHYKDDNSNDCRSDLYLICDNSEDEQCKGNIGYKCETNNSNCAKAPSKLTCIESKCNKISGLNEVCDTGDHEDCNTNLVCAPIISKCKGNLTYSPCENKNNNCVKPYTCIYNKCEALSGFSYPCDPGDHEDCDQSLNLACDTSDEICLGNISYSCSETPDCANELVCDSMNECKINIGDTCKSHDECIEGAYCSQNNNCTLIPAWCNMDEKDYWDENNELCYIYDDANHRNCFNVCNNHDSLKCVDDDWNDVECTILKEEFGVVFNGVAIKGEIDYYPIFDRNDNKCYFRGDISQSCTSSLNIPGINRLCVCEQQ